MRPQPTPSYNSETEAIRVTLAEMKKRRKFPGQKGSSLDNKRGRTEREAGRHLLQKAKHASSMHTHVYTHTCIQRQAENLAQCKLRPS